VEEKKINGGVKWEIGEITENRRTAKGDKRGKKEGM
jgi:hypothetical protein